MAVQEFRDHEIARLERSGWAANAPLREVLDVAGLRPPAQVVAECLDETADSGAAGAGGGGGSTGGRWERAECAVTRLREHFASFRFAGDVDYGLLAVPDAARFDTRGAVDPRIRCGQRPDLVSARPASFPTPTMPSGGPSPFSQPRAWWMAGPSPVRCSRNGCVSGWARRTAGSAVPA